MTTPLGLLATAAIVGGGVVGYAAVRSADAPGGVLGTDGDLAEAPLGPGGWLAAAAAGYLLWDGYRDMAKQYGIGWQPIALGTGGILIGTLLLRRGG